MSYAKWFEKHSKKHKIIVDKLRKQNYTKDQIIEYFCYENMQKNELDFCPLYKDNKKCHDMQKLNCYLCACPNFRFNDDVIKVIDGKKQYSFCDIDSKDGEQSIYGDKIHQNCTNCLVPHHKSYVEKVFDYDWGKIMGECCYKC